MDCNVAKNLYFDGYIHLFRSQLYPRASLTPRYKLVLPSPPSSSVVTAADLLVAVRAPCGQTWLWASWSGLRRGCSRRSWPSFSSSSRFSPLGSLMFLARSCPRSPTRCCSRQRRSSPRRSGEKRCVLGHRRAVAVVALIDVYRCLQSLQSGTDCLYSSCLYVSHELLLRI